MFIELLQLMDQSTETVLGMTSRQMDGLFRKYKAAAGVENATFHDTRRTATTRLAKIFTVMDLAKITGHRDINLLQNVYYSGDAEEYAQRLR